MGKKSLVIGAAIGYLLGARAGRKRYDQIVAQVSKLWNDPKVQSTVDKAQTTAVDTAKSAASSAKDAATSAKDAVVNSPTVQDTVQAAKDRLPGGSSAPRTTTLPATPPLNTPASATTRP